MSLVIRGDEACTTLHVPGTVRQYTVAVSLVAFKLGCGVFIKIPRIYPDTGYPCRVTIAAPV